jgi:hypothetical protein
MQSHRHTLQGSTSMLSLIFTTLVPIRKPKIRRGIACTKTFPRTKVLGSNGSKESRYAFLYLPRCNDQPTQERDVPTHDSTNLASQNGVSTSRIEQNIISLVVITFREDVLPINTQSD